jgi:hypothetical protein
MRAKRIEREARIQMLKYVLSYKTKFGALSAESENPRDLVGAYVKLRRIAQQISVAGNEKEIEVKPNAKRSERVSGKGETTAILNELRNKVLFTKFFSNPKTTGDTREKLRQATGKYYTSRKVSQALGILMDKGVLRRTGKRNYYSYSAV